MRIQGDYELHELDHGLKEKNSKISLIETEMGELSPKMHMNVSLPSVPITHEDTLQSVYDTVQSQPVIPEGVNVMKRGMLYQSKSGHQTFYNS